MQLLRPYAVNWANCTTKHVVRTMVLPSAFKCHDVKRFFDHGDGCLVATGVAIEWRHILGAVNERKCNWA